MPSRSIEESRGNRTHLDFDRYDALAKKDLVSSKRAIPPKPMESRRRQQESALQAGGIQRGYRPEKCLRRAHYIRRRPTWKT